MRFSAIFLSLVTQIDLISHPVIVHCISHNGVIDLEVMQSSSQAVREVQEIKEVGSQLIKSRRTDVEQVRKDVTVLYVSRG